MEKNKWDIIIEPKKKVFDVNFKEVYRYKDLLFLFVKRDIITVYKQTILGPIWYVVQPIMTMAVYIVIFGNIAGLPSDGIPKPLFYLCGIIIWNYFSECFIQTSDTFGKNQDMFGKVYFPRLIVPLSVVMSGLIKFGIQFLLFAAVYAYYAINGGEVYLNESVIVVPYLVVLMAALGLGFGLIFTSLTTKYRDLKFLLQFGVQLLMYATPIIYPMSMVEGKLKTIISLNPMAHIVETFKYAFLAKGEFSFQGIAYASICAFVILLLGVIVFSRTEKNFVDTV